MKVPFAELQRYGSGWNRQCDTLACGTACDEQLCAFTAGGDTRSRRIEADSGQVLVIWEPAKDITPDDLWVEPARTGLTVSNATLHRLLARQGLGSVLNQLVG